MIETKILLADSHMTFLELLKTYLRKTGVTVLSCSSGEAAFSLALQETPDLVFISTNLTGKNGLDCLQALKMNGSTKDIPVVIILTSGHPEVIENCRLAQCDEVLCKPVSRQIFLTTVNKYLDLEKRLTSRFNVAFPVHFSPGFKESFIGSSVNLSACGLFLESRNIFPVGTELTLDFILPNTDIDIHCKARVTWVNCLGALRKPSLPQGTGLQFLNLTLENETAIKVFLRKEYIRSTHPETLKQCDSVED
jgi:CheY-like chemotaxis protein/Tfp pilus assembly protein PilZ